VSSKYVWLLVGVVIGYLVLGRLLAKVA